MALQSVTLSIPEVIYERLKQRAARKQHSIEDELLEVVVTAVPVSEELPSDLMEALEAIKKLDDKALWRAGRSHLPTKSAAKLEALHHKRQIEGLDDDEAQLLTSLMYQYQRFMLIRAEAAALLKERGYDVSSLLKKKA